MARRDRAPRRNVFISHSSRDRAFVEKIVAVLHRHGIASWYAPTGIRGAQQWQDEIGRALRRFNWFVVVLSKNALKSKWVQRELAYAFEDHRYNKHIVPIIKTPDKYSKKLSWVLASIQSVDFSGDFDDGCADLLKVWGIIDQPD